jgi:hypothetical protein
MGMGAMPDDVSIIIASNGQGGADRPIRCQCGRQRTCVTRHGQGNDGQRERAGVHAQEALLSVWDDDGECDSGRDLAALA